MTILGLDQPFPERAADDLAREFSTLDARALAVIERVLVPAIDSADSARIERALREVEDELSGFGESIERKTREVGERVNLSHRRLFFEGVRLALGPDYAVLGHDQGRAELPFPGDEPASFAGKTVLVVKPNAEVGALIDLFVTENVKLVSTLESGIVEALRDQVVRESVLGSGDPSELRDRLLRQWKKRGVPSQIPTKRRTKAGKVITVRVEAHADLIARDQLAKLNLALTRSRQIAAGITHFRWKDRDDSRVRPAHRALDRRVFSWAEGAPGEGFPGEPVSCRCHAEAVLDPASVLQAPGFEVIPP